jgi:hypothetical protein
MNPDSSTPEGIGHGRVEARVGVSGVWPEESPPRCLRRAKVRWHRCRLLSSSAGVEGLEGRAAGFLSRQEVCWRGKPGG